MSTIALIMAAGTGKRTGLDFPKQYLKMGPGTVLRQTIDCFEKHPGIDYVQVVISPADEDLYKSSIQSLDLLPWISGGETRQISVRNGLKGIKKFNPSKVLIHDAARPYVTSSLIDRCLVALDEFDAVLPAMPIVDTLKSIDGSVVLGTLDREQIIAAQTPQCFSYTKILSAHEQFVNENATDDISLAELANIPVHWIVGEATNKKITTSEDITMIQERTLNDIRTGLGFDVHAFTEGRDLWLGGVKIPYELGLKGHSDADVALHALTDALLGAIGDGDIGTHFPPSDNSWKDASSDRFLSHAGSLVAERGGKIGNIDLTIICEAPRIGPYRDAMRTRIAEILSIEPDRISIKGTTTEKLGFTGRREGIAAQAIATVRLPE